MRTLHFLLLMSKFSTDLLNLSHIRDFPQQQSVSWALISIAVTDKIDATELVPDEVKA